MLKATKFRVQNFRNINDSDWIPLERVTAFVGRNESGKTTLLKALHKFNPATPAPYNPQREFPRDRYTKEFKNGADWPVCSVTFKVDEKIQEEITTIYEGSYRIEEVVCTRYYDGTLKMDFNPTPKSSKVDPLELVEALKSVSGKARRLKTAEGQEEEHVERTRVGTSTWASECQTRLKEFSNLRNQEGIELLNKIRAESEKYANPQTADFIEEFQEKIESVISEAKKTSPYQQLYKVIKENIPVFIYFDDYGVLDSAIYLPEFLSNLQRTPEAPHVRTVNAMFKHVGLTAKEISDLGKERAQEARAQSREVTAEIIAQDQQNKEARAIKLNSASLDITGRFSDWYGQRRHTIEYQADGDYFRIWVADDRRPGVRIELEGRSKGFQWFFSFYLIFLVESDEGHKDSILLLDEPGLHLHPTAQQELIKFFEKLSEANQLVYSTHSPFLIDGDNIQRVRPVTEDINGHSKVSIDGWPKDRETIFPLQAAAGYAMVRGLFNKKKNLLVEGMSDYYYLHSLSQQCVKQKRNHLPDDIYITPCGGTKMVGHIASLFLGQDSRPIIMLDGDEAGRIRQDALLKDLYAAHGTSILMLDEGIGRSGEKVEVEDMLGEDLFLKAVSAVIDPAIKLDASDKKKGSLPDQVKSAALRLGITLPDGWKATVAIYIVSSIAENKLAFPKPALDTASKLFDAISGRFAAV